MTEAKPGYLYNFSVDLGGGMNVAVQGNIKMGATTADFNTELDLVRNAMERQRARSAVEGLEMTIERSQATLARLHADIAAVGSKTPDKPLSHAEKVARDNAIASAEDLKKSIDKQLVDLGKLKQEAE